MRTRAAVVAILGAGPAGCAAALTLRSYVPELSVVLVSTPAAVDGSPAVGETLCPGVLPLLRYLGLHGDFLKANHLPAGGTASAWGSEQVFERNYLFAGRGSGWHLDRSRFDAWLLAHAESAGAHCIRGRAKHAGRTAGRWCIELDNGEAVSANFVVDATGRAAWLARHHGSNPQSSNSKRCIPHRDDALVAEVRWYVLDLSESSAEGALVESTPDGWWYSATLPGRRGVAMFMTDADLRSKTSWEARIATAPATRARLAPWRATSEATSRAANSQWIPAPAGDGWVAAGDAAAAFDPISSLGIGFSLRSGMEAARVGSVAGEDAAGPVAAAYVESIARIYADYRTRLRGIYQREGRWPHAPFWSRRRGLPQTVRRASRLDTSRDSDSNEAMERG